MTFILVQLASQWPWGEDVSYSERAVMRVQAEFLERQVTNPDSPVTGVVRIPLDLVEAWQQIIEVEA